MWSNALRKEDSGRNSDGFRETFKQRCIFFTNRQLFGMREAFRGVVVKEWIATPNERIDYSKHSKVLVEYGVSLHSIFWIKRCEVLSDPEVQK